MWVRMSHDIKYIINKLGPGCLEKIENERVVNK